MATELHQIDQGDYQLTAIRFAKAANKGEDRRAVQILITGPDLSGNWVNLDRDTWRKLRDAIDSGFN